MNPGDLVYVHASAEEQIKLYVRLFDVHGMSVVFGNTGWPCCTRHHQFETGPVADSYVMDDFQNKTGEDRSERILLVFADRTRHWEWLGRDERQIILRHVQEMSCQSVDTHWAGSIVIDDLPRRSEKVTMSFYCSVTKPFAMYRIASTDSPQAVLWLVWAVPHSDRAGSVTGVEVAGGPPFLPFLPCDSRVPHPSRSVRRGGCVLLGSRPTSPMQSGIEQTLKHPACPTPASCKAP